MSKQHSQKQPATAEMAAEHLDVSMFGWNLKPAFLSFPVWLPENGFPTMACHNAPKIASIM